MSELTVRWMRLCCCRHAGGSNLFTGCTVSSGRHQFISGSKSAGPNVFHECHATDSWNDIGPHHVSQRLIFIDRPALISFLFC